MKTLYINQKGFWNWYFDNKYNLLSLGENVAERLWVSGRCELKDSDFLEDLEEIPTVFIINIGDVNLEDTEEGFLINPGENYNLKFRRV